MADVTRKQNDTRPFIDRTLQQTVNGSTTIIALTTASAVKLIARFTGSTTAKINASCAIASAAGGVVRYTLLAADTDTTGNLDAEYEITWNDGGVETVPNDGYFSIEIVDDLG